jgi:hypothetical protein
VTLIRPANVRDACFVAASMRTQDWDEIAATGLAKSKTHAAVWFVEASPVHAYIAYIQDEPVAVFGVCQIVEPHYWSGWAFGTDRIKRAIPAITKFCLGTIKPDLLARGVRRVEVRSAVHHDISHRWLMKMGAQFEGIALDVGRNGEAYATYSWAKSRL